MRGGEQREVQDEGLFGELRVYLGRKTEMYEKKPAITRYKQAFWNSTVSTQTRLVIWRPPGMVGPQMLNRIQLGREEREGPSTSCGIKLTNG